MATVSQVEPVERILTALIEPLYEEQARRRGQHFSRRSGVPGIQTISELQIGGEFGGITMDQLATLQDRNHPMAAQVEVECSRKCGTRLVCMAFFADVTACDACREAYEKKERLDQAKTYWENICPVSLRNTDKNHPEFPKAQYEMTRAYSGQSSLLLYGETRLGKSRLAMWLLKRCLVKFKMHVGVLWPETLKSMKKSFAPLEELNRWGRYDLLLLDDALLAGAMDARLTDWLKDLIDLRMRNNRHSIITSQIGSADYKEQSNKFAEATGADKKLIEALCSRISETFTVIPFVKATAGTGEEAF